MKGSIRKILFTLFSLAISNSFAGPYDQIIQVSLCKSLFAKDPSSSNYKQNNSDFQKSELHGFLYPKATEIVDMVWGGKGSFSKNAVNEVKTKGSKKTEKKDHQELQPNDESRIDVYNISEVQEALGRIPKDDIFMEKQLITHYNSMLDDPKLGSRKLVEPAEDSKFAELEQMAPNFIEVIKEIRRISMLNRDSGYPFHVHPILLLGNPGVGKTHFAKALAKLVGTGYEYISMGSTTAGWILGGSSAQWKGSNMGKVADKLIYSDFANPVFLIDEIDKAGEDKQYDPLGALYALLEKGTAEEFKDEYLGIKVNARHIIWISTANRIEKIPDPILSRHHVYQIPDPSPEQMKAIVKNIFNQIFEEKPKFKNFVNPVLNDSVLDVLSKMTPRKVDQIAQIVVANAHARIKSQSSSGLDLDIQIEDIPEPEVTKRAIGFHR